MRMTTHGCQPNRVKIHWTAEVFLEPGVGHRYFIVSQRTRRVFRAHKVRGDFEFEPVVMVG